MKKFRDQFQECTQSGICEVRKLEKSESVETFCHGTIEIKSVCWCNRFNHQCRSDVCRSFRQSGLLN